MLSLSLIGKALMMKGMAFSRSSWTVSGVETETSKENLGKELELNTCFVFSRKENADVRLFGGNDGLLFHVISRDDFTVGLRVWVRSLGSLGWEVLDLLFVMSWSGRVNCAAKGRVCMFEASVYTCFTKMGRTASLDAGGNSIRAPSACLTSTLRTYSTNTCILNPHPNFLKSKVGGIGWPGM